MASSQLFRKLNFYKQKGFWALGSPAQEPQLSLCPYPARWLLPCRAGSRAGCPVDGLSDGGDRVMAAHVILDLGVILDLENSFSCVASVALLPAATSSRVHGATAGPANPFTQPGSCPPCCHLLPRQQ